MKRRPILSLPRFVVLRDGKVHRDDEGNVVEFRRPDAKSFVAEAGGIITSAKEYRLADR